MTDASFASALAKERDELCAEVEQLTRERDQAREHRDYVTGKQWDAVAAWEDQVLALKAEVAGLTETIAEWQAIHGTFAASGAPADVHFACRSEIERLRADNARLTETWVTLSEENQRLRELVARLRTH